MPNSFQPAAATLTHPLCATIKCACCGSLAVKLFSTPAYLTGTWRLEFNKYTKFIIEPNNILTNTHCIVDGQLSDRSWLPIDCEEDRMDAKGGVMTVARFLGTFSLRRTLPWALCLHTISSNSCARSVHIWAVEQQRDREREREWERWLPIFCWKLFGRNGEPIIR